MQMSIVVPFRQSELLLVNHDGQPFVPMRPVVQGMGLDWKSQHVKLTTGRLAPVMVEITTTGSDGKQYQMTCLPLRKLPGWLMSIHPNKVKPELRENILAYQNECDDVLWAYWNDGEALNPRTTSPAPEAGGAVQCITLHYADRHFRVQVEGVQCWFCAADLARVLGMHAAPGVVRHLQPGEHGHRLFGKQRLIMVSQAGLERALTCARHERAEPFRHWLAERLRQVVAPLPLQPVQPAALPVPLSREQQAALRTLINCRLDALPEAQRTRAASTCWLALKSAFGCTYKKIPQGQFTEAVSLVAQLPLEGELLESAPGEPPVLSLDRYETEHLYLFMSHYASLFQHYNAMLAGARALGSPVLMEFFDRLWEAHGSFSVLDKHRATLYGCYRQALEKTGKPLWEQNGGYAQHLGDAPLR